MKRILLLTAVIALSCAAPAAAHPVRLSLAQARWATNLTSERWLRLPAARITCHRRSARTFVCAFRALGIPHGRLESITCPAGCTVHTHFWGLRFTLVSLHHLVLQTRRRHSGYRFVILTPRSASGRGVLTGSG